MSKNPFYSPDEISDEAFLNHPRAGSSGYMLPQPSSNSPGMVTSPSDQQRQFLMKKQEIEERTLASANNSLGLLYESEKVGAATGHELQRQKEQLLRTEGRLDEINSTLKTSERHLNGIKSVFGGIKNYLFAKNSSAAPASPSPSPSSSSVCGMPTQSNEERKMSSNFHHMDDDGLDTLREENHPALRSRGLLENQNTAASVDEVLDKNLDEMAMGLSRLKGLALDLNTELDEHEDIMNRLDDKSAQAGIKVTKQNKDMSKLLKK